MILLLLRQQYPPSIFSFAFLVVSSHLDSPLRFIWKSPLFSSEDVPCPPQSSSFYICCYIFISHAVFIYINYLIMKVQNSLKSKIYQELKIGLQFFLQILKLIVCSLATAPNTRNLISYYF